MKPDYVICVGGTSCFGWLAMPSDEQEPDTVIVTTNRELVTRYIDFDDAQPDFQRLVAAHPHRQFRMMTIKPLLQTTALKVKRIYIAGPMTDLPKFNYPAFNNEAQRLRSLGYHVENPAENPEPPCKSWLGYMRMALPQLITCDIIALLPGWQDSKGARIERSLAVDLSLRVLYAQEIVGSTRG